MYVPGQLQEKKWESCAWSLPATELAPCWWLMNPHNSSDDEAKLLNRALGVLRAELRSRSVATAHKIAEEWRRRHDNNESVLLLLVSNPKWLYLATLRKPDLFEDPCPAKITAYLTWVDEEEPDDMARVASDTTASHDAAIAWQELRKLLEKVLSEAGEDIHRESFSATPPVLFKEMWQSWLARKSQENETAWRRAARLRAASRAVPDDIQVGDSEEEGLADEPVDEAASRPDPDGYIYRSGRLPKKYQVATAHAEAVLLDRVRVLLDTHYDQVHLEKWRETHAADQATSTTPGGGRRPPARPRAHRVDDRVLEARSSKRYEDFVLPAAMLDIFRRPADEESWDKAELLRQLLDHMVMGLTKVKVIMLKNSV